MPSIGVRRDADRRGRRDGEAAGRPMRRPVEVSREGRAPVRRIRRWRWPWRAARTPVPTRVRGLRSVGRWMSVPRPTRAAASRPLSRLGRHARGMEVTATRVHTPVDTAGSRKTTAGSRTTMANTGMIGEAGRMLPWAATDRRAPEARRRVVEERSRLPGLRSTTERLSETRGPGQSARRRGRVGPAAATGGFKGAARDVHGRRRRVGSIQVRVNGDHQEEESP